LDKEFIMTRPQGITILAVLAAIGGVLGIFGAFALFGLGALSGMVAGAAGAPVAGFLTGGFAIFWGLVTLAQSAAALFFAYGAWFLKPWAWMLGVGVEAAAIVINLVNIIGGQGGSVVSILISGGIIYYLFTPAIQRAFGRIS
jgi:hypothetical protein